MERTKNFARLCLAMTAALIGTTAFAQAETYAFTGTVTSATGIYSPTAMVGEAVTGTYTIDIANGMAQYSTLPVSYSFYWSSAAYGGSTNNLPANSSYVFSSTAQVGSFSYSTAPPSAYESATQVYGYPGGGGSATYLANEYEYTSSSNYFQSQFELTTQSGGAPALYSAAGLPLFGTGVSGTGYFVTQTSQLNYAITSLKEIPAVPEAKGFLLMSVGIGFIGFVTGRRKRAQ